ncbi:MAG: hypothetical protein LBG28_07485 [Tannerella sp.]|nr:hypothetical protein [Tannerella sp.]
MRRELQYYVLNGRLLSLCRRSTSRKIIAGGHAGNIIQSCDGLRKRWFHADSKRMGARDPRLPMSVLLFNDPQQDEDATIGGVLVSFRLTGQTGVYLPLNA